MDLKAHYSLALLRGFTKTCLPARQALLIMKITAIILLTACLSASANGYSQKVTLSEKNARLEKVFKEIKRQTGYYFLYNDEMLQRAEPITIELMSVDLHEALTTLFKNQPLTFSIIEKTIVIKPKTDSPVREVVHPQIEVKGRVVNENGDGVIATITVKGTNNMVSSDVNGYFTLSNVDENATLVITAVSVETMEVKINGRTDLEIRAKTKVTEGESVTVSTGYWTSEKRTSTGNITKITSKEIEKQPVNNLILALQGRVAGLNIEQVSGVPGGNFRNLQIRGQNSLRFNGNDPLFVIDGIPYPSQNLSNLAASSIFPVPLNIINPSDIESIEILKDADATAIYGSLGANGVILITTKNVKKIGAAIDINFYKGTGKASNRIELLNTQQYLEMRNEAFANDNETPTVNNAPDLLLWDQNRYTDWQKELIGGTAEITNANVSVSGGSELSKFFVGGGYLSETTVFPGNFPYRKGSLNFGGTHTALNKKLSISIKNNIVRESSTLPFNDLTGQAMILPPNAPAAFDADGKLNWQGGTWNNPYAELLKNYNSKTTSLLTSLSLVYEIIPGLKIQSNAGYNLLIGDIKRTTPLASYSPVVVATGEVQIGNNEVKTWIIEPQINYEKKFGKLKVEALAGGTFRESINKGTLIVASGFASDALINNTRAATSVTLERDEFSEYRYTALYARLGLNLEDKYLLNLTGRRDGSSRFGPDNRFGNFGAVGLAWLFSKEKFFSNLSFLSFGKIRGSYGITGNDQIGNYEYLSTYRAEPVVYQNGVPLTPVRLPNEGYKWEQIRKLEIGLELGFLNERINLNGYYYRNRSSNQLVEYPLPSATGFTSITANLDAIIENKGFEVEINTINIRTKNFLWATSMNLTIPRNKLVKFPGIEGSNYANTYVVGEPLNIALVYGYNGVNDQGIYQFVDFDSDGSISNPNDTKEIIRTGREYFGGVQNQINYKRLTLDFLFQFVKQTRTGYQGGFLNIAPGGISNQPVIAMDRWQKPGDITDIQRFTTGSAASPYSRYAFSNASFVNASFVRLKNISLSYKLPDVLTKKSKIQSLSIYIQAQNLFVITKYKFLDPETMGLLPPVKMITTGIRLEL